MDEQQLIQNPEALLALIQQAVQHLIEQRPDTAEQEAQLRAVAKAIEQLEKQRVSVPDSLRQTKMDLVAKIGQQNQFNQQLKMLGAGLTEVLEMIEEAVGKPYLENRLHKESNQQQRRLRNIEQPTTPRSTLRLYIIQALKDFGGSAPTSEVMKRIEEIAGDNLTPRDLELRNNGQILWQYNVNWARWKMVKKGILRDDSERGYWALNPDTTKK